MLNLLNAEFYKLFHSRYFWGIVAFNLFLSSVLLLDSIGETSSLFFASLYNVPILYFLAIVFSALFVGNDFGQRTLQSYINAGHNRGQILLAKLAAYQIACMTILALPLLVHELVNGKSEKMLDISLIDKDLEQLAGILNQYNDNQRQLIASTLRHENYLKESIANISHDLRTPLTVILGHLQLLRKEPLTDRQAQRIETIFHKAERMKELVQTFYDLSILDAEQITPRREDFNLSNLLINLITENAPALEAKNISPEIDLPPHSVYLHSDYSMVERILQNLLTNAIRYSSGDIKMSLKQARENRAIFTIENPIDSKTEINPARLFERFYTGDASRHNSGTGVGLAVVKLLTDKLGGNVSAEIKSNVLTVTLEIQ